MQTTVRRIEETLSKKEGCPGSYLELLFDQGTFVNLTAMPIGLIAGYGKIEHRLVFAYIQDCTVEDSLFDESYTKKLCNQLAMAIQTRCPIICISSLSDAVTSRSANNMNGYGKLLYQHILASGVVPQISVILNSCTGSAVYSPALTDFVYMVQDTSSMFLSSPASIKAITGETITSEQLGGSITHNASSGSAHFSSPTQEDSSFQIRRLLSFLPSSNLEDAPSKPSQDSALRLIPELSSLLPEDIDSPYDMKQLIELTADDRQFYEIQALYARNLIVGFARFHGQSVGIIANQPLTIGGCLDINASDKASRFIRFCDAFNLPLVTFVDVPGFLPDTSQEYKGIIRHSTKILYAYTEATVPKISILIRKAYGAAYLALCSKELGADLVLAWPSARIAIKEPAGSSTVLFRKKPEKDHVTGKDNAESATQESIFACADQIISPPTTRIHIIQTLNMLTAKRESRPHKKHGNIPL